MSEGREAELRRSIDTVNFIMSRCYSDEAYRLHQANLDKFISELNEIQRNKEVERQRVDNHGS